jgi:uncharacterized membrane protein
LDVQGSQPPRQEADLKETGRVEAFSDGVFAIAITLLVLDLRLPEGPSASSEQEMIAALLDLWTKYLAFAVSFAFIGIMWINHHRLFTYIARSNSTLLVLNLLLLMGVVVVPFPTGVLAAHLGHPGEQTAAVLYNGLFVFIAVFFNLLWRYASHRNRLLGSNADPVAVQGITRQYIFGPVWYGVAFILAFFSVQVSLLVDVLLALFCVLPGLNYRVPGATRERGRGVGD